MAYTATDREQIEELKKWWRDYGKAITIAVVVGLAIGFAWRYWQSYVSAKEEAASAIYQNMGQLASYKMYAVVNQDALQLQNQYGRSVYASLASFLLAQTAVEQGRYANAHMALTWIINHSHDKAWQQVARIRDARVLLQMGSPVLAAQVIAVVTDAAYQPMIDEVNGEIDMAEGKTAQAQQQFQTAKAAYNTAGLNNPMLDLRLAN